MLAESTLNVQSDFPVLRNNPGLTYLDSAATSLKPDVVIDEVRWFLEQGTASVYRGTHRLATEVTERFEDARATIGDWFGVVSDQVVLTRGATDGINLVANSLNGLVRVVTSNAEHHSNLLPWFDDAQRYRIESEMLSVDVFGRVSTEQLDEVLKSRPAQLVAISHVGNVLGTKQPISELADVVHHHKALLLVDAAQSAAHLEFRFDDLGADFLVCSGHKMLGPSGIGALVGTEDALMQLAPTRWGGSMIQSFDGENLKLQPPPRRWEAGSQPVESLLGWAAALEYLEGLDRGKIESHVAKLTTMAYETLSAIPDVRVIGDTAATDRVAILPFQIEGWKVHDAAKALSQQSNVCVRSGFHCAEPLHHHLGVGPTLRASFHVYNTPEDVEALAQAVRQVARLQVG